MWEYRFNIADDATFLKDWFLFQGQSVRQFTGESMILKAGSNGVYAVSAENWKDHHLQTMFFPKGDFVDDQLQPKVFFPPKDGTVHVESFIRGNIITPASFPGEYSPDIADPVDDIRLASAAQVVVDFSSGLVFDFFITNKSIYALYERLPFGWKDNDSNNNYHAFTVVKKICTRDNPEQYHKIRLSYSSGSGEAQWYIDDELKWTVGSVGQEPPPDEIISNPNELKVIELGGRPEILPIKMLAVGLGHFSLLGAYPTHNQREAILKRGGTVQGLLKLAGNTCYDCLQGHPTPAKFASTNVNDESLRLFGQGSISEVKYIKVYTTK